MNDGPLGELAAAILDGTDIDWDSAESSADADDRQAIRQLRILSRIADVYAPPPGPSWGPLRVFEAIGRGAFGEVYRAWDTRLDREVALKLLPAPPDADDTASSIIEEGCLMARVRHPNVATIYGAERIGQRIGLWMELVDGRTLEQLLAARREFSVPEVVNIGVQLAEAIDAVHAAGLLHRDVKAQNVMLTKEGRAVLMDFGTGKEVTDRSTTVAGTPLYLAPEILCDDRPPSVQSDVYALGVLLSRLLTGSYPVAGKGLDDLRAAHAARQRAGLRTTRPEISAKLARTIDRALDPDAARRYPTAAAFADDLKKCRAHGMVSWAFAAATAASVAFVVWVAAGAQGVRPLSMFAPSVGFAAAHPVIAVLPFENQSREAESELFVDGLTEQIILNLSVIDGLTTRSRASSFAFKNKPHDVAGAGRVLKANLILDGSVLRAGNRLRVNAQLIRVDNDSTVWFETFDRELKDAKDVFSIQDEISRAVVDRLRLALGPAQHRDETNLAAYDAYLKARALNDRRGPAAARRAIELLQQAIEADPNYAPAYAGLVHAYAFGSITYQGFAHQFALTQMRTAADKAMELDSRLAEAHAAMGVVQAREHDWAASDQSFRKALEYNPRLTQFYSNYSFFTLRPLGRFGDAEAWVRKGLDLDPYSLDLERELAAIEFTTGRNDDAIKRLLHVREMDPGAEFEFVDMFLARAYTQAGRLDEAFRVFTRADSRNQGIPHYLAQALVRDGRRDEAERIARDNNRLAYRATIIYAALGDLNRAFEALGRTIAAEPPRVPLLLTWPELAPLRADPRFAAFRSQLNLPER